MSREDVAAREEIEAEMIEAACAAVSPEAWRRMSEDGKRLIRAEMGVALRAAFAVLDKHGVEHGLGADDAEAA